MHSQAPQDLWLPTGWPSSVTSGWSAQCTPQTLNKLHRSYTLHIGIVCTTPISQVFPTICTKCAHCTEGPPSVTSRECAKFAHITHSTNCTYPTHNLLCWRYIAQCVFTSHRKFVAPTVASFRWPLFNVNHSEPIRARCTIHPSPGGTLSLFKSSNTLQLLMICVPHVHIAQKQKTNIYTNT